MADIMMQIPRSFQSEFYPSFSLSVLRAQHRMGRAMRQQVDIRMPTPKECAPLVINWQARNNQMNVGFPTTPIKNVPLLSTPSAATWGLFDRTFY